jgi:hypothetical protein
VVKFVCLGRNALPVELITIYNSQGNRELMFVLRRVLTKQMDFMNRRIAVLKQTEAEYILGEVRYSLQLF